MVIKRIIFSLITFILVQYSLFVVVHIFFEKNCELYFYNLENIDAEERYKNILSKEIISHENLRLLPQGLPSRDCESNLDSVIVKLESAKYGSYLANISFLNQLISNNPEYKIIGKNVHSRNTGFLVRKNSNLSLKNKSNSLLLRYIFWTKNNFLGNFGTNKDNSKFINAEIREAIAKSITLVVYSIVMICLMGIFFSYLFIFINKKIVQIIENFLQIFSSIPDFIIAFFLIYIFLFRFPILDGYKEFYREFSIQISIKWFCKTIYYFFLPAIVLTLSNGNLTFLIKNLYEKIISITKSEFYKFSIANGMKRRYIYFTFIFKQILPILLEYVSQKIPLIIGASILVEKVFDIHGLGYLLIKNFAKEDVGFILIIFSILYLFSIVLNIISFGLSTLLNPKLRKLV